MPSPPPTSSTPKPLAPERYQILLRDVRQTHQAIASAASDHKLRAWWKIGGRIRRARITEAAGYHNTVLRDLAADTAISLRSLQLAVSFHLHYPEAPTHTGLSWSHYVVLLRLSDASERDRYEALAIDQHLSARQLAAAIALGFADDPTATPSLERPTQPSYLYAAKVHHIVDGDTLIVDIDLGFDITRRERIRLASLDAPELPSPEGRKARDFVATCLLPAQTLVIQTRRADLHGRYLAHLFYTTHKTTIDLCFTRGHHLNDQLIQSGHATPIRIP